MNDHGQTYIIAEAGVNHNGSLDMAKQLVDVAVKAGADAVKFQTFTAETLVGKGTAKADYQKKLTGPNESQFEMLKKLELTADMHRELIGYCQTKGIEFLSTPFDVESVKLLAEDFCLSVLKIASGEITNAPLLLAAARTGKPIILSTGMSYLGEVEQALAVLAFGYLLSKEEPGLAVFQRAYCSNEGQALLREKVVLLHCTSEYPAPFSDVNLLAMDTLKAAFSLPVGLSDHSIGISVPVAAVARGAKVIEKHFTLDRNLPGPDHQASLDPEELKLLVESVHQVEQAMGTTVKHPAPPELNNLSIIRKSIVAKSTVAKGETFTEKNLTFKRPGNGLSPFTYWDLLGTIAQKDYRKDEVIRWEKK